MSAVAYSTYINSVLTKLSDYAFLSWFIYFLLLTVCAVFSCSVVSKLFAAWALSPGPSICGDSQVRIQVVSCHSSRVLPYLGFHVQSMITCCCLSVHSSKVSLWTSSVNLWPA